MAHSIPRDFIQLLLARTDIVDLIDQRIPLRKKSSNNYFACCPFHTEKSASFSVSQVKQFYYCFGCGAHGNAIDFLIQYDHLVFTEAVETLAKNAGLEIPRESKITTKQAISNDLYELLEHIAKYYQQQLKNTPRAIQYLKERGLSGEIAKEFEIGFAPMGWDHVLQTFGKTPQLKQQLHETGMLIKKEEGGYYDRFRDRIMYPIRNRRGQVIGFGGRILDQGEPKYLNSPDTALFQKGHELYGLSQTLKAHRELKRAIIVEGYMDVIALCQHGITYAMATLGTATTAIHLERLFRHTSEIIFCFDGDAAGRQAAWRALLVLLPLMHDGIQARFLFLPNNEDPDSLIRKENKAAFEERIQNAGTLSQVFFQFLTAEVDLSSMDGRARLVKLATKQLDQLPESVFRQMMFDELAKRARTDQRQFKQSPSRYLSTPRSFLQKARVPSALRLAITLLIQEPHLAKLLTNPLPLVEMQGFDLLQNIIAYLKSNPDLTTGALLEYWREEDTSKLLAKLAQTEHMIPIDGIQNEFLGAIKRLEKLAQKQAINKLLSKANQSGLSPEEKKHLQDLIHHNTKEPHEG